MQELEAWATANDMLALIERIATDDSRIGVYIEDGKVAQVVEKQEGVFDFRRDGQHSADHQGTEP